MKEQDKCKNCKEKDNCIRYKEMLRENVLSNNDQRRINKRVGRNYK